MNHIPARDITGECAGECRNLVREGEDRRQREINLAAPDEIESYPNAAWAQQRDAAPGMWGGHA